MKKMCFVVLLYGEKYQWYIPLYIYSINQAYPDYDIRIYLMDKISPEVNRVLSGFSFLKNYTIVEDISNKPEFKVPAFPQAAPKNDAAVQAPRCVRWLLYDQAFEQYDAVYMADVDIFIAKERFDAYEQHIKHCRFMEVPFSNTSRRLDKKNLWTPHRMLKDIIRYGLGEFLQELINRRRYIYRLSGAHFVIVKDYYEKVLPLLEDYRKEVERIAKGRSKKWNRCFFNNEAVLYDLVKEAGFSVPESDAYTKGAVSPDVLPDIAEVPNYRPHHGLHLGIWRQSDAEREYPATVRSDAYQEYYRQFCELRDTDSNFRLLLEQESDFVKAVISNMDQCMGTTI